MILLRQGFHLRYLLRPAVAGLRRDETAWQASDLLFLRWDLVEHVAKNLFASRAMLGVSHHLRLL